MVHMAENWNFPKSFSETFKVNLNKLSSGLGADTRSQTYGQTD
jgi:hypothetical protein